MTVSIGALQYVDTVLAHNRFAKVECLAAVDNDWSIDVGGTDSNGDSVIPLFLGIDNFENNADVTVDIDNITGLSVGAFTKVIWNITFRTKHIKIHTISGIVSVWLSEKKLPIGEGTNQFADTSITSNIMTASPLTFNAPNDRARSRPKALAMVADLTYMKGFAKVYGVTGGAAKPVYWVWRDDVDDAAQAGCLRWAWAQALAGGGGRIIFEPRNELDILVSPRFDVFSNLTLAAPGGNVRIRTNSGVAAFVAQNVSNFMFRWLELDQLIDATGINNKLNPGDPGYNVDQGGPADQFDAITIIPTNLNGFWFDGLTINKVSDGAIDVSSSTLVNGTVNICNGSISRTIIRGQYKSMLCGSASTAAGDVPVANARKCNVSYYENWYDHCAERHPRCAALGYADSVNNIVDLCILETDDGAGTGEYGIASLYGGWVRTRGDLIRSFDSLGTLALQCSDGSGSIPASAAINEGSVAENNLIIQTFNESVPTALPAVNYDLAPVAVPAVGSARETFRNGIMARAGARVEAMPRGIWIYSATSVLPLNGITVRAAPDRGNVGRYIRIDPAPKL